ncbi:hypothetical protein [Pseudodesulfovibrio portus]|uniref:Uncharacterized protein n=1 Tax=Pseudodesulfovibrio portus TaxID=231439 RepID=A0ABM8AUQ2_9BACT|nr:hypothetical protein [Pseudodesulfovibrio portus]BDQ35143.1 hypothetical protein JCM14722_26850 [Pseudodesulfovibrio portus]
MKDRMKSVLRYVKAAPWPYMTGGASLALAFGLKGAGVARWSSGDVPAAAVLGWWGLCWLVVAVFALADGVSRHREYRRIKAMFVRYGFSERILRPLARSRCQRDAALHAARETGHLDKARSYFRGQGYRWYHILPDLVVRNPLAFASPTFLRTSFMPGKKMRA